jgi:hypothetical protein
MGLLVCGKVDFARGELRFGGRVDFEGCAEIVFLVEGFMCDVNNASSTKFRIRI